MRTCPGPCPQQNAGCALLRADTATHAAAAASLQVCGRGDGVEGDAVVPLASALLEGSEHVVVPGAYHSMSRVQTFSEPSGQVRRRGRRLRAAPLG